MGEVHLRQDTQDETEGAAEGSSANDQQVSLSPHNVSTNQSLQTSKGVLFLLKTKQKKPKTK